MEDGCGAGPGGASRRAEDRRACLYIYLCDPSLYTTTTTTNEGREDEERGGRVGGF